LGSIMLKRRALPDIELRPKITQSLNSFLYFHPNHRDIPF